MASINYLNCIADGVGTTDDIDHLGNRRIPVSYTHLVIMHSAFGRLSEENGTVMFFEESG